MIARVAKFGKAVDGGALMRHELWQGKGAVATQVVWQLITAGAVVVSAMGDGGGGCGMCCVRHYHMTADTTGASFKTA